MRYKYARGEKQSILVVKGQWKASTGNPENENSEERHDLTRVT